MTELDNGQLTLFQEDFPVSLFPWLESKREKGTTVTYGRRCSELSEPLRRVRSSVRTYLESCALPPGMWSRTWSVKALTSSCLILKLRLSARGTGGSASRLLPTVRSHEMGAYQYSHGDHDKLVMTLTGAVRLWQTPNVPNGGRVNPAEMSPTGIMPDGRKRQVGLEHQVKMVERGLWPTPAARDYKGANSMEHLTRESGNRNHADQLANAVKLFPTPRSQSAKSPRNPEDPQAKYELQTIVGGQLNPEWVEWLMGFPLGWTSLPESRG